MTYSDWPLRRFEKKSMLAYQAIYMRSPTPNPKLNHKNNDAYQDSVAENGLRTSVKMGDTSTVAGLVQVSVAMQHVDQLPH